MQYPWYYRVVFGIAVTSRRQLGQLCSVCLSGSKIKRKSFLGLENKEAIYSLLSLCVVTRAGLVSFSNYCHLFSTSLQNIRIFFDFFPVCSCVVSVCVSRAESLWSLSQHTHRATHALCCQKTINKCKRWAVETGKKLKRNREKQKRKVGVSI